MPLFRNNINPSEIKNERELISSGVYFPSGFLPTPSLDASIISQVYTSSCSQREVTSVAVDIHSTGTAEGHVRSANIQLYSIV